MLADVEISSGEMEPLLSATTKGHGTVRNGSETLYYSYSDNHPLGQHCQHTNGNVNGSNGNDNNNNSRNSHVELHELLHHLHDFDRNHKRRLQLLMYMGLILVYFALVSSLLAANNLNQDAIEEKYFLPFHYTEFWSAFIFTLLEAFILIGDSAWAFDENSLDVFMLYLLGFNVVTSLMSAMLFTLHPATYEVPSHIIEYGSQISVTLVDFIFIIQQRRGASLTSTSKHSGNSGDTQLLPSQHPAHEQTVSQNLLSTTNFSSSIDRSRVFPLRAQVAYATLLVTMDVLKFLFYLDVIPSRIGTERSSHYFEFVGEMLNSLWAFAYAKNLYVQLSQLEFHDLHHHTQRQ